MGKHNRSKFEKAERNLTYALRFHQRRCERCRHRSAKHRACPLCGGRMR